MQLGLGDAKTLKSIIFYLLPPDKTFGLIFPAKVPLGPGGAKTIKSTIFYLLPPDKTCGCRHVRGSITFPDAWTKTGFPRMWLETIAANWLTVFLLFLYKDFVILPRLLLWLLKWMQTCSRQYYVSWWHPIHVFMESQNVFGNNSKQNSWLGFWLFLYKDFVMLSRLFLWLLKWMQTCSL